MARLLVLVAVLFFVWRFIDRLGWGELGRRLGEARPWFVTLATACLLTRLGLIYLRWAMVLEFLNLPVRVTVGVTSLMTGVLLNHVTPTARVLGGLVRARGLGTIYGQRFSVFYASILVEQLGNQLVQTVLLWIATVPLAWHLGWHRAAAVVLVMPLMLALLLLIGGVLRRRRIEQSRWSPFWTRRLRAWLRRLGPIAAGGATIARTLAVAFRDGPLQLRLAACGVGVVAANAAALWLVLESLGTPVAFFWAFATVSVGLTAGLLTGTPGGFATTEAAMIALLVALGVPELDAAAGVLLFRGLHYTIVLVLGSISAVLFETRVMRAANVRSGLAATAVSESPPPDA